VKADRRRWVLALGGLVLVFLLLAGNFQLAWAGLRPSASRQSTGHWRFVESTHTDGNQAIPPDKATYSVAEGAMSGSFTSMPSTGDPPYTTAFDCSWTWTAPNGLDQLTPGETISGSMQINDRSDWAHFGIFGDIDIDQASIGTTYTAGLIEMFTVGVGGGKKADSAQGQLTVPDGSAWQTKMGLKAKCGLGLVFERDYEWVNTPANSGTGTPAAGSCLATIQVDSALQPGQDVSLRAVVVDAQQNPVTPAQETWIFNGVEAAGMQWDGKAASVEYRYVCPLDGQTHSASLDIPPFPGAQPPSNPGGPNWIVVVGGLGLVGAAAVAAIVGGGLLIASNGKQGAKPAPQAPKYILQLDKSALEVKPGQSIPLCIQAWRVTPSGAAVPAPEASLQVILPLSPAGLVVTPAAGQGAVLNCAFSVPKPSVCADLVVTVVAVAGGTQTQASVSVRIVPLYDIQLAWNDPQQGALQPGGKEVWARAAVTATPPDPRSNADALAGQIALTVQGPGSDWIRLQTQSPTAQPPYVANGMMWIPVQAVPPAPGGAQPAGSPSLVARLATGSQAIEKRLTLNLTQPAIFDAWGQGKKQVDVVYDEKSQEWSFGGITVYFHPPEKDAEVVPPPEGCDLFHPQFLTEPADILDVQQYGAERPGYFTANVSLHKGADLSQLSNRNPDGNAQIPLTIRVSGDNQSPYESTITYTLIPTKVSFQVVAHDGALQKLNGSRQYAGLELEPLMAVADGEDRLPLAGFFRKSTPAQSEPGGPLAGLRGSQVNALEDIGEVVSVEWVTSRDSYDFRVPEPDAANTRNGFLSYTAQSARLIEADPDRIHEPARLAFEVRLKPETAAIYQLETERVEIAVQFQYPKLWLWVVPGRRRDLSEAYAYLEIQPAHKSLPDRKVELAIVNPAASTLSLHNCPAVDETYSLADVGGPGSAGDPGIDKDMVVGSAHWGLKYAGMTWENLGQACFQIRCSLLDQKGAPVLSTTAIVDVNENVGTLLRTITTDIGLRAQLDNPYWLDSSVPYLFRGPIWNFMQGFGKAPYVCSVMRDTLIEYMDRRRNYMGRSEPSTQAAVERMKSMNGIEFEKYRFPVAHLWAGIFLSGMDRYGDYRCLDPWWEQRWLGEWNRIEALPSKYYEEKQIAKCAAASVALAAALAATGIGIASIPIGFAAAMAAISAWFSGASLLYILGILGIGAAAGEEAAAAYSSDASYAGADGTIPSVGAAWLRTIVQEISAK
jgi:hypothetical protein